MEKYYKKINQYEATTNLYMSLGLIAFSIVLIIASHAHEFVLLFTTLVNIIAVFTLILYFVKSYKWKIQRTLKHYHLNEEAVVADLDRNAYMYERFEKVAVLGNKYALFINPDSRLIVYDQTIWIYLDYSEETVAGINIKNHYIVCVDEDGKKYKALISDGYVMANEIYSELKKLAPWCYFGYDSTLNHMLKNDLQTMKTIVQQKTIND